MKLNKLDSVNFQTLVEKEMKNLTGGGDDDVSLTYHFDLGGGWYSWDSVYNPTGAQEAYYNATH
ncbi:MAG: hypothetical protein JXR68_07220 [Bacteroidales bacterium]|nr:hypothetical protein [Bacteroidales bacterium]